MANLETRVTELERQAQSQTAAVEGVRADVGHLRSEVGQLRSEVGQLRSEMHKDASDLGREMGDLRSDLNRRIDLLDAKVDRHFVWLAGILVSGFITVIGALVGVVFQLNTGR